ncbi:hypothetical protein [Streptomyces sp. NPDC029526]|uniref:hypothetical protein n=1 Tax=Streptomyces sp. NPDC029526 TaxID=3155728 RepID=UPI0033EC54BE
MPAAVDHVRLAAPPGSEERLRAFRPARKADPGLRVTALHAWAARPAAHGVTITWDDGLPGRRRSS